MEIVISDTKTGKAYKVEGKDTEANALFIGKRISEVVDADILGLGGYVLEIPEARIKMVYRCGRMSPGLRGNGF